MTTALRRWVRRWVRRLIDAVLTAAARREQRLITRAARSGIARQARTRHPHQQSPSLNRRIR